MTLHQTLRHCSQLAGMLSRCECMCGMFRFCSKLVLGEAENCGYTPWIYQRNRTRSIYKMHDYFWHLGQWYTSVKGIVTNIVSSAREFTAFTKELKILNFVAIQISLFTLFPPWCSSRNIRAEKVTVANWGKDLCRQGQIFSKSHRREYQHAWLLKLMCHRVASEKDILYITISLFYGHCSSVSRQRLSGVMHYFLLTYLAYGILLLKGENCKYLKFL